MTIDRKNTKIPGEGNDVLSEGRYSSRNHKGARDHLVSRFLFITNEECSSLLEINNVLFSQETHAFRFLISLTQHASHT